MGSSDLVLPLLPIAGRKPAPGKAVRTAIAETIAAMWRRELSVLEKWGDRAAEWLAGKDAHVRIEVATELRVACFSALAEHWVRFVFAWQRPVVEAALARVGFAIPASAWPRAFDLAAEARFFAHEGKVGRVAGKEVQWSLGLDDAALAPTPLAELPEHVRTQVTRLARCACPTCEGIAERMPQATARAGHHLAPVTGWESIEHVHAMRSGALIVVATHRSWGSWTMRTLDGTTVETIPELTDEKRIVKSLVEVDGTLVAVLGYNEAEPPCVVTESRDGGMTWSKPKPNGLPPLRIVELSSSPHRPEVVFAMPFGKKELFRSDDGGRTFRRIGAPKFDGKPPASLIELLAFGDRTVARWLRKKKGDFELAASEDGGKKFATIASPLPKIRGITATSEGDLVVDGHGTPFCFARSPDGGRSWTVIRDCPDATWLYLGGRWFVVEYRKGLHVSDDDGATWTKVLDGQLDGVYPDRADPTSAYVRTGGAVARVVVGTAKR